MASSIAVTVNDVEEFHRTLVAGLQRVLGPELVGAYAGGSFAFGDFDLHRSDIDVAAVCAERVDQITKEALVDALRHESIHCPARGLEFVLYAEPVVRSGTTDPGFELNLNSGERMTFRADYEPGAERHWFAIDRSILAARGKALYGPPAAEVFAPIPRRALLEVVADAVRWHRENQAASSDAVLNACRSLRFAVEGTWSSKLAAGAWAAERHENPALVARALAARHTREPLSPLEVDRFLRRVELGVHEAALSHPNP